MGHLNEWGMSRFYTGTILKPSLPLDPAKFIIKKVIINKDKNLTVYDCKVFVFIPVTSTGTFNTKLIPLHLPW